jgi:hypothetical protein
VVDHGNGPALRQATQSKLRAEQTPAVCFRRIKEISWNAQNRLHRRFCALVARGKSRQKAITAIARELLGFIWALLQEFYQPGSSVPRAIAPPVPRKRSYELRPA